MLLNAQFEGVIIGVDVVGLGRGKGFGVTDRVIVEARAPDLSYTDGAAGCEYAEINGQGLAVTPFRFSHFTHPVLLPLTPLRSHGYLS